MNELLRELLARRLPLEGVAAWSARLPDRTVVSHCFTDWFTARQVEQALTRLALAVGSLAYHQVKPARLCWRFEHARVHLALRPDGASLAIFVENRPGLAATLVEAVLDDFARLA